ncbi:unnamed protein product [Moneuplotes crassus]|uniref:AP2/ERF domain-containing protein n=1 Tax=Euplotes crassus TaxID=5936 RepID=A0AAD1XXY8_EUPCR|nr:unnamed protein product [Moneuplotes crassus]
MTCYHALERTLGGIYDKYCWGLDVSTSPSPTLMPQRSMPFNQSLAKHSSLLCEQKKELPAKIITKKATVSALPDISQNLRMVLQIIGSNQEVSFRATSKSSRGLHNGASRRRSRYIGLLGNGKRWQVLINVRSKKKYIGTFKCEKEAAVMHDLYSIGINGMRGKTNFNYDSSTLQDMIMDYFTNEGCFDAHKFISRV